MASSSRSEAYDLERHQNFEQLLTLLKRGRDTGHIYRYQDEIQELLEKLGRYTPESFELLMTDPERLDRTILSLESLVSRWAGHNPALSESVNDLDKFKVYSSLLSALEANDEDQIVDAVHQLNFSSEVSERLISDPAFRNQTIKAMQTKLDRWSATPAGGITKLDPVWVHYFSTNKESFVHSMYTGKFDLKASALLASPKGIEVAQYTFGLPINGVREDFMKAYNKIHFTQQCSQYNNSYECDNMAAKQGDEKYLDKLSIMMLSDLFGHMAEGGHFHLVEKYLKKRLDAIRVKTPVRTAIMEYGTYKSALEGAIKGHHYGPVKEYIHKLETAREIIGDDFPGGYADEYDLDKVITDLVLDSMRENGDMELFQMIRGDPTLMKYKPFKTVTLIIARSGNLDNLKWLESNCLYIDDEAVIGSIRGCQSEIFDYTVAKLGDNRFQMLKNDYLGEAIRAGCLPITRTLIRSGAKIASYDVGIISLRALVATGKTQLAKLVIENFGPVVAPTFKGYLDDLNVALTNGFYGTVMMMVNMPIYKNEKYADHIFNAVMNPVYTHEKTSFEVGLRKMKALFDKGLKLTNEDLKVRLGIAIMMGTLPEVQVLVYYILNYDNDFDRRAVPGLISEAKNPQIRAELQKLR